jgi:hypothetical protein
MVDSLRSIGNSGRWKQQLLDYEQMLLDPDTRHSAKQLERLLHPDFIEFGSSGRVYNRRMMIEMMTQEVPAPVVIRDFEVRALSADTALVTYRSIGQAGQEARRSSIWVNDDKGWRVTFHQGTRIPNRWGAIT